MRIMNPASINSSRRRRKASSSSAQGPAPCRIRASLDLLCLLRDRQISSLLKEPLFSDRSRLVLALSEATSKMNNDDPETYGGGGRVDQNHNNPSSTSNLTAGQRASQIPTGVSNDLARVYENLTRSKTPQTPAAPHHPQHEQSQYENQHYPHSPANARPSLHPHPPQSDHQPPLQSYQIPPPPQYPPPPQAEQSTAPGYPVQQQQQVYFHSDPNYYQQPPYSNYGDGQLPYGDSQRSQSTEGEDTEDNGAEEVTSIGPSGRLRKKRRSSDGDSTSVRSVGDSGGRKKKKSKAADGRWSKRFTWPEELHRDFVSAIFDVGLKHSSPSTILDQMPKHEQITTERIKSHLQKYRIHRAKSKKEFMNSYDSSLTSFKTKGVEGVKNVAGGAVGAHLAYSTMNDSGSSEESTDAANTGTQTRASKKSKASAQSPALAASASEQAPAATAPAAPAASIPPGSDYLILPQLTDLEKKSPMGAAMGYLMGLFFSLKQQLIIHRSAGARNGETSIQDLFNSFNAGPPGTAFDISQPLYGEQVGESAQPQPSGAVLSAPSVRTDLEENNMMKLEMQSQMAITNKMREMKQQELNKYKSAGKQDSSSGSTGVNPNDADHVTTTEGHYPGDKTPMHGAEPDDHPDSQRGEYQGAGEAAAADGSSQQQQQQQPQQRNRGISVGGAEEFWNTEIVDENLFEFLMNN